MFGLLLLVPILGALGYEGYNYWKASKSGTSQAPSPGAGQMQAQSYNPLLASAFSRTLRLSAVEAPAASVAHATLMKVNLTGLAANDLAARTRQMVSQIIASLPPQPDPSLLRQVTLQSLNSLAAAPTRANINSTIAILQRPANGPEANGIAQQLQTL
jgi:hypothetical protein